MRGVFADARPEGAHQLDDVRKVGLAERFVVPPFGDAHTHMLADVDSAGRADELFLDRGIYYVTPSC